MPCSGTATARRALGLALLLVALSVRAAVAGQRIPREDPDAFAANPQEDASPSNHAHVVPVEDLLRDGDVVEPPDLEIGDDDDHDAVVAVPAPPGSFPTGSLLAPPSVSPEPDHSFTWPVHGRLTSYYGRRRRGLHTGLDIAATPGTIVTASAPGRVVRAGSGWGRYGKAVVIDHGNGWCTLYAHASRLFVEVGAAVTAGQAIAAVGRTGNATGPHLHFELWEDNRAIDPLRFLEPLEAPRSAALTR